MGVRKFRSVEELPEPVPASSVLRSLTSACSLGSLSAAFGNRNRAPRGVHKFRSIQDADAHRVLWEASRDGHAG